MHADQDLGRRVERAIARQACLMAEAAAPSNPAARAIPIADGFATFLGKGALIGRAHALGLSSAVPEAELDKLDDFYGKFRAPAKVELCPLADPSLARSLAARGYRPGGFINCHARPTGLHPSAPGETPGEGGCQVRPITRDEVETWVSTVARGFSAGSPVPPAMIDVGRTSAACKGLTGYIALLEGRPVAGGSITIVEEDGFRTAIIAGASTLPEARRRGIQTALLAARMRHAVEHGATLMVIQSRPGSASERNMHRAGFRLIYSKIVVSTPDP